MGNQHGKEGVPGPRVTTSSGSPSHPGAPSGDGPDQEADDQMYQTPPATPQEAAALSRNGADAGHTSRSMGGYGRQGSAESSGSRQFGRRGQHFRKREEPTSMGGAAIMQGDRINKAQTMKDGLSATIEDDSGKKRHGNEGVDSSSDTQSSGSRIHQISSQETKPDDATKKASEDPRKPAKAGSSSAGGDNPRRGGGRYARFHEALASSRLSHTESSDSAPPAKEIDTPLDKSAPASSTDISDNTQAKSKPSGRQFSEEEHVTQATVVQQARTALPEVSTQKQKSTTQQESQVRPPERSQTAQQAPAEKKPLVITTSTDTALNQRLSTLMQVAGGPTAAPQQPQFVQDSSPAQQRPSKPETSQKTVSPRPASISQPPGPSATQPKPHARPVSLGPPAQQQQQASPRAATISTSTDAALNKRLGNLFKVASVSPAGHSPIPSPGAATSKPAPPDKVGPPTRTKPSGVRSPRSSLTGSEQPPAASSDQKQTERQASLITTSTDDALNKRLGSLMKQAGETDSKQGIVSGSAQQSGSVVSPRVSKPQFVPATLGPQGYVAVSSKPKYFPATAEIDRATKSSAAYTKVGSNTSLSPSAGVTGPTVSRKSPAVSPARPITRLQQLSLSAQDYTPVRTSQTPLSPREENTAGASGQQEPRRRTSAPHTAVLADAAPPVSPRRGSQQAVSGADSLSAGSSVPSLTPYQRRSSPMPLAIPEAHSDRRNREGIQSQVPHLEAPVRHTQQDIQEESLLAVVTQTSVPSSKSPVSAPSLSVSKPNTLTPGGGIKTDKSPSHSPNRQFARFHEALASSRSTASEVVTKDLPTKPFPVEPARERVISAPEQPVSVPPVTAKTAPTTQASKRHQPTASSKKPGPASPFSSPKLVRATKLPPLNVTAAQSRYTPQASSVSESKTTGVPGKLRERQPRVKTPPPHIAEKIAGLGQHVVTTTTKYDAETVTPATPTIVYANVPAPVIPGTTLAVLDSKSAERDLKQQPHIPAQPVSTPPVSAYDDKKTSAPSRAENKTRVGSAMQRLAKKASGEQDKERQSILNKAARSVDYQPTVVSPEASVRAQQDLFESSTSEAPHVEVATPSQTGVTQPIQVKPQPAHVPQQIHITTPRSVQTTQGTAPRPVQPSLVTQQVTPVRQVQPAQVTQQVTAVRQVQPAQVTQQVTPVRQVQPAQVTQQVTPVRQVQPAQVTQQVTAPRHTQPPTVTPKAAAPQQVQRAQHISTDQKVEPRAVQQPQVQHEPAPVQQSSVTQRTQQSRQQLFQQQKSAQKPIHTSSTQPVVLSQSLQPQPAPRQIVQTGVQSHQQQVSRPVEEPARVISTAVTLESVTTHTADDTAVMSQRSRRTPERAQSLQERRVTPERADKLTRLRQKIDQPDAQLMKILNRRSNYLEDWETQLAVGETQADRSIEDYERKLEAEKENRVQKEVPVVDQELKGVLKSRRGDSIEQYEQRLEEEKENKIKGGGTVISIKGTVHKDEESIVKYEKKLEQEKETRMSRAAEIADNQLKVAMLAKQEQEKEESKTEDTIQEYEKRLDAARESRLSNRTTEISDKRLHNKLEALRQEDAKAELIKQSSIEEYERKIEADKEERMKHAADMADQKLHNIFQAKRGQEDDKYFSTKEKVEARTAMSQQYQAELKQQPQQQAVRPVVSAAKTAPVETSKPVEPDRKLQSILQGRRDQEDDKYTSTREKVEARTALIQQYQAGLRDEQLQPQYAEVRTTAPLAKATSLDSDSGSGGLQIKSILKKRNSEDDRSTAVPEAHPSVISSVTSSTTYPPVSGIAALTPKSKTMGETKVTPIEPDSERMSGVMRRAKTFDAAAHDVEPKPAPFFKATQQSTATTDSSSKPEPTPVIEVSPAEVVRREKKDLSAEEQAEEDEKRLSVAERIFLMQNKLEDESYTPRLNKSGVSTPKSKLQPVFRSIPTSPNTRQTESTILSKDEGKLLEKLSDVAMVRDVTSERRKRFQTKPRDDQRRMTQPVTLEELRRADSLESVSSFRSEVLSNASDDIFEQQKEIIEQQKAPAKKQKGQEVFPAPFKPEKLTDKLAERRRSPRYKTQPITTSELSDSSPETEFSPVSIKEQKAKYLKETEKQYKATADKSKQHHKSLSDILAEEHLQMADALNIDISELHRLVASGQISPPSAPASRPTTQRKKTIEEILEEEEKARADVLGEKVEKTIAPGIRMAAPVSKPHPSVRKLVRTKTLEEILAGEEAERAHVLHEQMKETPKLSLNMQGPVVRREPERKAVKQKSLEELIADEEREKAQVLQEQMRALPKPTLTMQGPVPRAEPERRAAKQMSLEELIAEEEREKAHILHEQLKEMPRPDVRMEAPRVPQPVERKITRAKTLEEILAEEEKERAAIMQEQLKETPKHRVKMEAPRAPSRHPVKKLVRAKTLEEIIAAEEHDRAEAMREEQSESPKPETRMEAPVIRRQKQEAAKARPKSMRDILDQEEETRLQALRSANLPNMGLDIPPRKPEFSSQVSTTLPTVDTPMSPSTPALPNIALDSDDEFDKLVERNYMELKSGKSKQLSKEEVEHKRQQEKMRAEADAQIKLRKEIACREQEMIDFTMSMDVPEKDSSKLSLSEKKTKFNKSNQRFQDKKRLDRPKTQPVTGEEVHKAAELNGKRGTQAPASQSVDSTARKEKQQVEESEDELSNMTLSEKLKLFTPKKEFGAASARVLQAPVMKKKSRRGQSRFQTQPVTTEEVQKAKVSPLAMSMVKPPDPEVLEGMSAEEQQEYMVKYAAETLGDAKPQHFRAKGEEATGAGTEPEENKSPKGILKTSDSLDHTEVRGILKPGQLPEKEQQQEVHGILKHETHTADEDGESKVLSGILKKDSLTPQPEPDHGILKHDQGLDNEEEVHSILKKESPSQEKTKGILKKESSFDSLKDAINQKSAIKKQSSFEVKNHQSERGGSQRRNSGGQSGGEHEKSALKKESVYDSAGDAPKSALKQRKVDQPAELASALKPTRDSSSPARESSTVHGILKASSGSEPPEQTEVTDTVTMETSSVAMATTPLSHKRAESQSSDEGDSSSSERYGHIKNPAVMRRRMQKEMRKTQGERYHTQPVEASPGKEEQGTHSPVRRAKSYGGSGRHFTQPVTSTEKESAGNEDTTTPLRKSPGGSIADRLASLHKSGDEEWKKRVSKSPSSSREATPDKVVLRDKSRLSGKERPSSIANRLTSLQDSQQGWKGKVGEKDVKRFTVAGRLDVTGKTSDSPLSNRQKRTPKMPLTRESEYSEGGSGSTPTSPNKPILGIKLPGLGLPLTPKTPTPEQEQAPGTQAPASADSSKENTPLHTPRSTPNLGFSDSDEEKEKPARVEVPRADDETFTNFFEKKDTRNLEKVDVTVDDFNHVFIEANDILPSMRKLKPQRKQAGSRNPLRKLQARDDIQLEYTEVRTDVAEKELRRIKREQIAGAAHFASDALAGLASKENFSKVKLKKSDSSSGGAAPGEQNKPFRSVMLLHVKGRRHCQTRLVEPNAKSINSGDCFVLVTSDAVFVWIGEFSNVIEKAKAAELGTIIAQKKDMGCKTNNEPYVINENKQGLSGESKFWKILGGRESYRGPGPADEDELYESFMAESTMVFSLVGEELVPVEEHWGSVLKYEMLQPKMTYVFDFGAEMYVWTGKQVPFEKRKKAMKLAREMWDKGFDYSECELNPITPLRTEAEGGLPLECSTRPEWAVFGKVNQNMETQLFKEKIIDWPDTSRLIKVKGSDADDAKAELDLKPFDAAEMVPLNTKPVSLVLEGSNLGRGTHWKENHEGLKREFEIIKLDVDVWHVLEYEHFKLEAASQGQFHDGDTYVIRWHYMISQTGMRGLRGQAARPSTTGRERCAYFFWQGKNSSVTEQGASALMTVELDDERGPQVRVEQGKEPPAFTQLFDGTMVTYIGKREEEETNTTGPWRLFVVGNELANEAYLTEIQCGIEHLRSRGSFVLINIKTGMLYVWQGAKSPEKKRTAALEAAQRILNNRPVEMCLHKDAIVTIKQIDEGEENKEFYVALGSRDKSLYNSLLNDTRRKYRHSPRLFYMNSVSGVFEAKEVLNPSRSTEHCSPLPFLQSDLYKATQPALFLLDDNEEVYVWQGWWPEKTEDTDNVQTGSAEARFNVDRRCALETTLHYCREKNPDRPPKASVVFAGLEPLKFTNLFPTWVRDESVYQINKEVREDGCCVAVDEMLEKLSRSRYTFAELQERPLPDGVDPLKLETYLPDDEFQDILGMPREEFYAMPGWKQVATKKEIPGLF